MRNADIRARDRDAAALLRDAQRVALIVGVFAAVLCVVGVVVDRAQFYRSYLAAFVFWSGLSIGGFGTMMIYFMTKGVWGAATRRFFGAIVSTLPLVAVGFVPVILGIPALYPWANPAVVAGDDALMHKAPYLNVPAFIARAVFFFVAWLVVSYFLLRWADQAEGAEDPATDSRIRRLSAGGLVLFGLTTYFAVVDWIMSLQPRWYSTIFEALQTIGDMLGAFALVVLLVALLANRDPVARVVRPQLLNDLGSLLLAFLMLWAYMAFGQLLLIWSGNLSEEIPFYLARIQGGWEYISGAIVVLQFAFPFVLLVIRRFKRNPRTLALAAGIVLVMRAVESYWLVLPVAGSPAFQVHWLDPVAFIAIGGLWIALLGRTLLQRPLIPTETPILQQRSAAERRATGV